MEKRLVFGLVVAMVLVAIGGVVAEAADVFKAANYASRTDTSQWLVLNLFPADVIVSTQGALVAACPEGEECTANNTFLLLLLAINLAGNLFFDFDTSSLTTPGATGCPPPTNGYSGEVMAPAAVVALVIERVFQAVDGCSAPGGCVAYTKFASGAAPIVREVGRFFDLCLPEPGDPPRVNITATDPDAAEPSDPGTFTVSRTGPTTAALTVNYNVNVSGTATNGTDYTALTGTVIIPAGSSTAPITVTPIDDGLVEGNETVIVTLIEGADYNVGFDGEATVTITDNEVPPPPTVTIEATDPDAAEPSNPGTFTVSRTGSTADPLDVNYTVGGTAESGDDYVALPGSVTIPAGSSTAPIIVAPVDDDEVEGDETVIVTLTPGAFYNVGDPGVATVTIADNDE